MKLNKPKVTESQSVLEDYVASLLVDPSKNIRKITQSEHPAVTSLPMDNAKTDPEHYKISSRSPKTTKPVDNLLDIKDSTLKEIVSDVIPLNKKSSQANQVDKLIEPVEKNESVPVIEQIAELIVPEKKKIKKNKIQKQTQERKNEQKIKKVAITSNQNKSNKGGSLSKNIEQSHTEKVNQEIEDYSQREFKDSQENDPRLQGVKKLLSKIALANVVAPKEVDKQSTISPQTKTSTDIKAEDLHDIELEASKASFEHREKQPLKNILGGVFQTLVFEVGKLPLAVPLIKLGGIVNVSEQDITPLVGTPEWFMGLAHHEKGNLMVIDTRKFLMPEQSHDQQKDYRYLIILDDSLWALACHSVGDAKNLTPEDIRWSSGSSKRPWFAGMVVEYMSALIEVDKLINMLTDKIVD